MAIVQMRACHESRNAVSETASDSASECKRYSASFHSFEHLGLLNSRLPKSPSGKTWLNSDVGVQNRFSVGLGWAGAESYGTVRGSGLVGTLKTASVDRVPGIVEEFCGVVITRAVFLDNIDFDDEETHLADAQWSPASRASCNHMVGGGASHQGCRSGLNSHGNSALQLASVASPAYTKLWT